MDMRPAPAFPMKIPQPPRFSRSQPWGALPALARRAALLCVLTALPALALAQTQAPAPAPQSPAPQAPAPQAPEAPNTRADILWYGVIDDGTEEQDPETRRTPTDRVPARLGVTFGYAFQVSGPPAGSSITVKQVARYPQTRRNAETGRDQATDEADTDCVVGKPCLSSYSLEVQDELITGEWSMEIYFQGRKIGEQKFNLRYDGI
jgi:hypothetical protein